jgi:hypothetical protein
LRSGGQLSFHIDSLYALLYRLEERGWIKGIWVEKPGERRFENVNRHFPIRVASENLASAGDQKR